MENVIDQLPSGGRVMVIRLRSMGDCVLTTPALSLLRKQRPDLRIAVVVEDRFKAVFEGNEDIDRLMPPNVAAVARWRAELCLNLHGGTRSIALTTASGARWRAGFAHFRGAALYNVRIPTTQEILGVDRIVHTAEHLASAVFHLGVPVQEVPRAKLAAERNAPPRPYAIFHPVASQADKTWPANRFVAVARHMQKEWGIEPVFIAASGEDLTPFIEFRTYVGATLDRVKTLIANASLFAGNDSGPAHIAAAFGLPTVVVFGSSNAEIWRPWQTPSAVLQSENGIESVTSAEMISSFMELRSKE